MGHLFKKFGKACIFYFLKFLWMQAYLGTTAAAISSVLQCDSCILWLQHTPSCYSYHPKPHIHTHHLTHFIPNARPAKTTFHQTHAIYKKTTTQGHRNSSLLHYISFSLSSLLLHENFIYIFFIYQKQTWILQPLLMIYWLTANTESVLCIQNESLS